MNQHELMREMFSHRRWAVVGATDDTARYGYKLFHVLRHAGYEVTPIHPTLASIDGVAVATSLSSMAQPPEVVNMVVNPRIGLHVMQEIAGLGIRYAWMQPGTRSEEIREFASRSGIQLVENCVLVRAAMMEHWA
jgi:predicted CoA-binding protein